ncbi:hypothetical protein NQ314_014103 [Rhamnusium bicolor]|uniref:DDE Tnp4 domain-containing protein n=1 Tax=Rhamnusium bicolor TaxID=1586634 RepID=A0AAV8X393_9CUCU|nr:hypothetical protein NQ314_014103 [Rhamnusium bicolor]
MEQYVDILTDDEDMLELIDVIDRRRVRKIFQRRNPVTAEEQLFNELQIRTRNPIERTFGIWKRRFPILAFGIRLKLHKVEAVVIATAVLHNIATILNEEMPPIDAEQEEAIQLVNDIEVGNVRLLDE